MPVEDDPEEGLRRLAPRADTVLDLADEPVVPASSKLRLAALALSLGLAYEAPGARLEPPRYEPVDFAGPKLAVIAHRQAHRQDRGGRPLGVAAPGRGRRAR